MTKSAPPGRPIAVFLNVPFDPSYERLAVALVSGVTVLGRVPHCVLEVPEGPGRLRRVVDLMQRCSISIHDLSRVETVRAGGHRVPRFNMPFELGLAMGLHFSAESHRIILLERKRHRLQVTLSDMNGYDPEIHDGTQEGILRATLNCLGTTTGSVGLQELKAVTRRLSRFVASTKRRNRARSVFEPQIFRLMVTAATLYAQEEGFIE